MFRSIGFRIFWDFEDHIITNCQVIEPVVSIPLDYMHLEVHVLKFEGVEETYIGEIVGANFLINLAVLKRRIINIYRNTKTSDVTITSMPSKIEKEKSKMFRSIGFRIAWNFEGHIVTNYHVIRHIASIPLDYVHSKEIHTLNSEGVEETYIAEIVCANFVTDLDVLKSTILKSILEPITVEESTFVEIVQKYLLIGASDSFRHNLVSSSICGVNRVCKIKAWPPMEGMIQIDVSTNLDISGTPLLDYSGRMMTSIEQISAPKYILKLITVEESTTVEIGQECYLIGAPRHLRHSLISGRISGLNHKSSIECQPSIYGMIQVHASTNSLYQISAPKNILRLITVEESTIVEIGQECYLIGAPRHLRHSLISGRISGLNRKSSIKGQPSIYGMIQVHASTNSGIR